MNFLLIWIKVVRLFPPLLFFCHKQLEDKHPCKLLYADISSYFLKKMYNSLELMFKRAIILKIILINIAQMLSRKLVPFQFPLLVWRAAHFHIPQEQEIILFKLLANSK